MPENLSRPHSLDPKCETVRCVIAYKNFAANLGISHIGLGVSALNSSQVLRRHGIWVDVWPIKTPADLVARLQAEQNKASVHGTVPISHVVISAPWISTYELQKLVSQFLDVHFAVVSHSNVAFLHADPRGMQLLREGLDLSLQWHNFYNVDPRAHVRPPWHHGKLRIGRSSARFGCSRTTLRRRRRRSRSAGGWGWIPSSG